MTTKWTRRNFITSLAASSLLLSRPVGLTIGQPLDLAREGLPKGDSTKITILHTNDTHSQIEPFAAGTRFAGMGGVARRATFVKKVRAENPNTLMVDAGDFFQGTPYFNFYKGEVEIKAMSAIGYDVVTLGNHDFDNGAENLAEMLKFAKFDIVSSNYEAAANSPLKKYIKPYVVKQFGALRVGLFGLGIAFQGLVLKENHQGISYNDPIEATRKIVKQLQDQEHVDLIVGMSHLGTKYDNEPDKISDYQVATAVPGIDFIVGGHTHILMKEPISVRHPDGKETILFQVGKSGLNVGRVDFLFVERHLVSWQSSLCALDQV